MSFFGSIGRAFHSVERSIEHTAKNVAHEAAQAEKSVVKTVLHVEKQVEHAAKSVVHDTVQISKEAKQAFHSEEKSIEHTAKNVAHEAAQAEKSVVKTVLHVEKQVEHAAKVVVHDTAQISKEAKQAFHSTEKSIEHTAKNVAHEAPQAEKQVVQTVKNPEQTAKQIKTAISKYKESAVAFGTGAGDAALSDVTFGTVQKDSTSNHPVAYKAGEMIGHAVSTLVGMAEVDASTATEVGGFALSGTGVGSLVGVPAMAVAVAGVTHGGLIAAKGTSGLVQSGKDLYNLVVHGEGKALKSSNGIEEVAKITKGTENVEVTISKSKYPESAKHIEDAQKNGHPTELTIKRDTAKANRKESLKGLDKVKGKDLDEYPPAMFEEGGKGSSVKPIPQSDNRGAGSTMGHQLRQYPDGTKIKIKIIE